MKELKSQKRLYLLQMQVPANVRKDNSTVTQFKNLAERFTWSFAPDRTPGQVPGSPGRLLGAFGA